jgi:hypothetical protein
MTAARIVRFLRVFDTTILHSALETDFKKGYSLRPHPEDQKMYFIRTEDPVR